MATINEAVSAELKRRIQVVTQYASELPWWAVRRRKDARGAIDGYTRRLRYHKISAGLDEAMGRNSPPFNPDSKDDRVLVHLLASPAALCT